MDKQEPNALLRGVIFPLSAAPTPTHNHKKKRDFSIVYGRFTLSDFSPLSCHPALRVKAVKPPIPVTQHQTVILYHTPVLVAGNGLIYRALGL